MSVTTGRLGEEGGRDVVVFRDEQAGAYGSTCIRFQYESPGGRFLIAEPVHLAWREVKPGEPAPPTFVMPGNGVALHRALTEHLERAGYIPRPASESKIAGELEATKKHLEDARAYIERLLMKVLR